MEGFRLPLSQLSCTARARARVICRGDPPPAVHVPSLLACMDVLVRERLG